LVKAVKQFSIRLSDDDLARLDELRPEGTTRPAFIRNLLRRYTPTEDSPTYEEAVALLARSARAGKVTAQIALERALRADEGAAEPAGELARLLRDDD
jgi:Ribbon-helix-helix protein, copG family